MLSVLYILAALVVLQLVVTAHELGHWAAFRKRGVAVPFFGVGIGPTLFRFRIWGTEFRLGLVPALGYVIPMSEDLVERMRPEAREALRAEQPQLFDRSCWLENAPPRTMLIGAAAGPLASAIFAFAVGIVYYSVTDVVPVEKTPVVAAVAPDSPAEKLGLQVGDEFVSIGSTGVRTFSDIRVGLMLAAEGRSFDITVEREGVRRSFTAASGELIRENRWEVPQLGVQIDAWGAREVGGPLDWAALSLADCGRVADGTRKFLVGLVHNPTNARHASGPIGMVDKVQQAGRMDLRMLLWIAAMISMALAVFNLLPAAILDGTRMLFAAVHMLRGKPLSPQLRGAYTFATALALFWLIGFSTYGDIARLFVS